MVQNDSTDLQDQLRSVEEETDMIQDVSSEKDERLFHMGDHFYSHRREVMDGCPNSIGRQEENLTAKAGDGKLIKGD